MKALAHLGGVSARGHDLILHLLDVARRARLFAEAVRPGDPTFAQLANWAGLLHDLGKYRTEFQDYLWNRRPRSRETQHAVFGAVAASNLRLPRALPFAINGHHAGLHDLATLNGRLTSRELMPGPESGRLLELLKADLKEVGEEFPELLKEFINHLPNQRGDAFAHHHELLVRMLFSCLVDADYLDIERYMRGQERASVAFSPAALFAKAHAHVQRLSGARADSPLLKIRQDIFESCVREAEGQPGFYSLTTPTGGGKTLAGLAFALRHAERHRLQRVIIVIPFLSIIEQNAGVYRDVLGDDAVIEHHSAVARPDGDEGESEPRQRSAAELAAENWDAPVIVTTSVQFLESLFARNPSRCRKLHNLARSVVVFDEVQTLPHLLLEPILSVVRDLQGHFGTSFVFCSATQPRFKRSTDLPSGFEDGELREIAPDPTRTFGTLNRVVYRLPLFEEGPWDWDQLVDRVLEHPQVLVIVNLRRHAAKLFERLRKLDGTFHLSSAMCAEHRSDTLGHKNDPKEGTIYHALKNNLPCRVVSTQVVEAGVDIDFPVVFRHLGPLDAIIQSAGRCDREGRLSAILGGQPGGLVVIFELKEKQTTPPGYYQLATTLTRDILRTLASDPSQLATDPDLFADYHQQLVIWKPPDPGRRLPGGKTDSSIQEDRTALRFEEVARKFRVIEEGSTAVIVPYGKAASILEEIERKRQFWYRDLRRLQRFTVNLFESDLKFLGGLLEPIVGSEDVLKLVSGYDSHIGVPLGELPPDAFTQW